MSRIVSVCSDSDESSREVPAPQSETRSSRTIRAEERRRQMEDRDLAREAAKRKGKAPVFRKDPPSEDVQGSDGEQYSNQYFEALMRVPFIPTRCADLALLGKLGIVEDVRTIFKTMGLGELPFVAESSIQEITCQFLASLTLHINPTPSNMHDLGHIEFSINEQTIPLSLHALATLFELQEGTATDWTYTNFNNLEDVWRSISAEEYVAGVSKASTIRHPAIRYAHTYLAHTFYSRKDATTVEEREMVFLAMGIKPMLKKCLNKRTILGDGTNVNMAVILTKQLMQLKEEAIRPGRNKLAQLNVGSFVTAILKECGIPIPWAFEESPKFIDEEVLSNSLFLGDLVNGRYIYRFNLQVGSDDRILLPNQLLTDMRESKNVVFLPSRALLLTKIENKAARGKDSAGPSTAVAENSGGEEDRLYGPERYHFTPYQDPIGSRPLQEAHRHIGLLQRLCYYQERSMKEMSSSIVRLKKDVTDLRQKMGCEPGTGRSAQSTSRAPRKRKASRSPPASIHPSMGFSSD